MEEKSGERLHVPLDERYHTDIIIAVAPSPQKPPPPPPRRSPSSDSAAAPSLHAEPPVSQPNAGMNDGSAPEPSKRAQMVQGPQIIRRSLERIPSASDHDDDCEEGMNGGDSEPVPRTGKAGSENDIGKPKTWWNQGENNASWHGIIPCHDALAVSHPSFSRRASMHDESSAARRQRRSPLFMPVPDIQAALSCRGSFKVRCMSSHAEEQQQQQHLCTELPLTLPLLPHALTGISELPPCPRHPGCDRAQQANISAVSRLLGFCRRLLSRRSLGVQCLGLVLLRG